MWARKLWTFIWCQMHLVPARSQNQCHPHQGLVSQSWLTLCNPRDCSPPGSSVYGILEARILEWVAIHFSRGSSQLRDRTLVSCIEIGFFTIWAIMEAHQRQAGVTLQLTLHLPLLTILQLYRLPPPLPAPVSNPSCLFTRCQLLYASCCTVLPCFSWYCTMRLKMFIFCVFLMYYLCETYYKPITV